MTEAERERVAIVAWLREEGRRRVNERTNTETSIGAAWIVAARLIEARAHLEDRS